RENFRHLVPSLQMGVLPALNLCLESPPRLTSVSNLRLGGMIHVLANRGRSISIVTGT
ncbi:uncharacterized protein METZ01_LOCUS455984, partial [marine metagenome]